MMSGDDDSGLPRQPAGPAPEEVQATFEYKARDDFAKSLEVAYRAIRERVANGGPGWEHRPCD